MMDRYAACVLLGCKDRELAGIEDGPDGLLLITFDGSAHLVVDGEDGPTLVLQPRPEVDAATGEVVVPEDAPASPAEPEKRGRK